MRHSYEPINGATARPWTWRARAATGALVIFAVVGALAISGRLGTPTQAVQSVKDASVTSLLVSDAGKSTQPRERAGGHQSPLVSETSSLDFITYNAYTVTNPIVWWKDVTEAPSTWKHLAEPHRESTFEIATQGGSSPNDKFAWTIDGVGYEGPRVAHTFTAVGVYDIELRQTFVTGETRTMSDVVTVKYVRRELRSLLDEDRNRFLDAMETLYRLPTEMGVSIFGKEYLGIEFFVQIHLDGAGVLDCDHWHDDAGIMTHHVGYTLQFEQALQVVDPSVSVPYWEYTLDEYQLGKQPDEFAKSVIFDDDWFGEMSPENEFHTVTKGRWAFTPVARDAWDKVHNPYGLLRSPWNTDPTPFVTRHDRVDGTVGFTAVSCGSYYGCFKSSSLATMNQCLNGGTHGPIHIIIGGNWDSPDQTFVNAQGWSAIHILAAKALWRRGYIRYPESCALEDEPSFDEAATPEVRAAAARIVQTARETLAATSPSAAAAAAAAREAEGAAADANVAAAAAAGPEAVAAAQEQAAAAAAAAFAMAASHAAGVEEDPEGRVGADGIVRRSRRRRGRRLARAPANASAGGNQRHWQRRLSGSSDDCKTSCPADILTANNMTAYDVLLDAQSLYWLASSTHGTIYYDDGAMRYRVAGKENDPEATDAYWERTLAALCDFGHVGEMFTSAAPYDPTFWVLHPAAERLLNARRLVGRDPSPSDGSSWSFDETWGYTHMANTGGDMGVVCDWSKAEKFTDLPTCEKATCGGHNSDDVLPFRFNMEGQKGVQMTNEELLAFVYPTNDKLPYMYDSYTWDWCEDQGISLPYT